MLCERDRKLVKWKTQILIRRQQWRRSNSVYFTATASHSMNTHTHINKHSCMWYSSEYLFHLQFHVSVQCTLKSSSKLKLCGSKTQQFTFWKFTSSRKKIHYFLINSYGSQAFYGWSKRENNSYVVWTIKKETERRLMKWNEVKQNNNTHAWHTSKNDDN